MYILMHSSPMKNLIHGERKVYQVNKLYVFADKQFIWRKLSQAFNLFTFKFRDKLAH